MEIFRLRNSTTLCTKRITLEQLCRRTLAWYVLSHNFSTVKPIIGFIAQALAGISNTLQSTFSCYALHCRDFASTIIESVAHNLHRDAVQLRTSVGCFVAKLAAAMGISAHLSESLLLLCSYSEETMGGLAQHKHSSFVFHGAFLEYCCVQWVLLHRFALGFAREHACPSAVISVQLPGLSQQASASETLPPGGVTTADVHTVWLLDKSMCSIFGCTPCAPEVNFTRDIATGHGSPHLSYLRKQPRINGVRTAELHGLSFLSKN